MLTSRCLKGVMKGYPLNLVVERVDNVKTDFNPEFLKKMMPKIDYLALRDAAKVCGLELPENYGPDDMEILHKALFETEVITGQLICPESGRKFPITDGIPNMLCNENEV
ncbi:Multifunctional methyltransferase subunit TRM112-like protein, partial [Fragariocoptes setiger]